MSLTVSFGKNQDLEDDTTDIENILNSSSWYPLEHVREESSPTALLLNAECKQGGGLRGWSYSFQETTY